MKYTVDRVVMYCILAVVGLDYIAQIPYYLHQYYFPHHAAPPLFGTLALTATLIWFLLDWVLLARRGSWIGFWLLLTFLQAETSFYTYNMVIQVTHGFAPFFHLQNPDPLLWIVFAIGYLNQFAGVVFIVYLIVRYRALWNHR